MEVLKDKFTKQFNYTSRYAVIPCYYNTSDNKYLCGISRNLTKVASFTWHTVEQGDSLDSLSYKYYGRPDLFLVIANYNDIQDSFIDLYKLYYNIKIPALKEITYER